jgi:hypothetical protein
MAMLNNQRVYRKYVQRFFCAMFSFGRAESDEDSHAANMFQFQGTQLLQFLHQTCITQLGWKVHHGAGGWKMNPAGMELWDLSKNWW